MAVITVTHYYNIQHRWHWEGHWFKGQGEPVMAIEFL